MQPNDKTEFALLLAKAWRFYGKVIDPEAVADWHDLLEEFPMEAIRYAIKRHLTDPERGQYLPKPADLIRHLPAATVGDGRPGPDEAWGLLLRFIADERETGVYTEEMRAGWEACDPILKLGDEVGARRCFLETYARALAAARQTRCAPHWTVTLGTDPQLRSQRLHEAVAARRLTADHAYALLPGPAPTSLDQVAGLLAGPEASAEERNVAERLRALAAMLRASHQADAAQRAAEMKAQRELEAAEKQRLWELAQRQDAA